MQWGRVLTAESPSHPVLLRGPGPKLSCQCGKVQAPQHVPTLHAFQVGHPSLVPRPVLVCLLALLSLSKDSPSESSSGVVCLLGSTVYQVAHYKVRDLQVLSVPGKGEGPLEPQCLSQP